MMPQKISIPYFHLASVIDIRERMIIVINSAPVAQSGLDMFIPLEMVSKIDA